eukprot:TRINITY_DN1541_c0_g1_i16.p1 TRINITY_DN1541_c0_g1~~TRINITY_DN1541_c0_g1_i16.p1  ORF type:complete len:168 (-),score=13.03 TRINITY_DN1541_c0_g1_i16:950-1453(-)
MVFVTDSKVGGFARSNLSVAPLADSINRHAPNDPHTVDVSPRSSTSDPATLTTRSRLPICRWLRSQTASSKTTHHTICTPLTFLHVHQLEFVNAPLADSIIEDHAPHDLHTVDVSSGSSSSATAEFVGAGSALNAASALHNAGTCIPCKFTLTKRGCNIGLGCNFCH